MKKKIYFTLFKTLIADYRQEDVSRERFITEWGMAQKSLKIKQNEAGKRGCMNLRG